MSFAVQRPGIVERLRRWAGTNISEGAVFLSSEIVPVLVQEDVAPVPAGNVPLPSGFVAAAAPANFSQVNLVLEDQSGAAEALEVRWVGVASVSAGSVLDGRLHVTRDVSTVLTNQFTDPASSTDLRVFGNYGGIIAGAGDGAAPTSTVDTLQVMHLRASATNSMLQWFRIDAVVSPGTGLIVSNAVANQALYCHFAGVRIRPKTTLT